MAYFLSIFLSLSLLASAQDFGTFGTTFAIEEEDLILVLRKRLSKMEWDENSCFNLEKAFTKSIKNPKGKSFPKATCARIFNFDPTICLNEDIKDQTGKVIVQKGTRINPLERNSLRADLLFFNGNDPKQIEWAKKQRGIWILTEGKPLEIEEREDRPVYFDQAGYLTGKLGIKSLPASVRQVGKKLTIEEIPCL
jgi:conjugal transfer pilus assembly protein TraW